MLRHPRSHHRVDRRRSLSGSGAFTSNVVALMAPTSVGWPSFLSSSVFNEDKLHGAGKAIPFAVGCGGVQIGRACWMHIKLEGDEQVRYACACVRFVSVSGRT
jgi:hypothetical protein